MYTYINIQAYPYAAHIQTDLRVKSSQVKIQSPSHRSRVA